ncbi:hypothetical protein Tco_1489750, partial [Tanacetum coccineum]
MLTPNFNSCESNSSEETHESMPEPVVNEPKVVSQPKVWFDAPIIEEYESDSDDEHVSVPSKEQEPPSCAFINTWFSHLIRDYDFHEKIMAKQAELNKRMTVLTRTGRIQVNTARTSGTNTVNTARHNFNSQAVPTNAAKKVNTVKPIVNNARPKTSFHKTLSPIRRPFNKTTTLKPKFSNQKVNTVEVKAVSAVGGKGKLLLSPQQDYPQRALLNKGIVDSRCSRHITGNKAYLAEYQDFNGGLVAFGGSKGYITGKGRKSAKGEPSVHKDPLFDEIPEDTLDNMETEDSQDVGRTRDVVVEEKENAEDVLSTAQQKVSTDKEKVSTERPIVSTDGSKVCTDKQKDSTDDQNDSTDEQNEGTDDQTEGTDDHTEGERATQTTQT